jgi:hypothetical protein
MHEHTAAEAGHRIPHQRFVTFAKRPSIGRDAAMTSWILKKRNNNIFGGGTGQGKSA